ncbi:hypothetical protein ACFL2O_00525 [Thermodesulfobacteriota bacterium]
MKKIISIAIAILVLAFILSVIRPYWGKYSLTKDIEAAAIYGTKHSISQIEGFLEEKNQEKGRDLELENFEIEKDKNKTVIITVVYTDYISLFGWKIKELEFELEAKAHEIKEML